VVFAIMKNRFSWLLVAALCLSAGVANANYLIRADDAAGKPGDTVTLNVFLESGDFSYGGNFLIGFDASKLKFNDLLGGSADLFPLALPSTSSVDLSLANFGVPPFSSGLLFSVLFDIVNSTPGDTPVAISGFAYDDQIFPNEIPFDSITPVVTILAPQGNVPEPGVLGLLGMGLAAMACFSRKVFTITG
jgi:hypothetical protein